EQEMPVQGSYTQEEKLKLKSKSIPHERKGKIKSAIAIKLNVSANKNITASDSLRPFQDIYGSKWAPELGMAYELKPMYSEWFGSVGIVFSVGFGFHEGIGIFKKALVNNKTGTAFASESQTRFKFFTIPIGAGLNYRFNLLRILRPYIQAQGALIGFIETRSDEQKNKRGFSKCALTSGGINLLLDWFSKNFDWDIYEESGIKHSYLTLDYTKVFTYSSNVAFNASSWNLGFTYEF
ncbi:MAG: hypothetical protein HY072_08535, partial [Deltaproteobacteria bacterium]|nr:hypothetical protein [Deltaproteobacteria bacterium]